ncbi:MAG: ZIP family metal transporter [Gammaproteobacteria bacterium]|nr:ZIP family metal transporter [Gammaproteobacteria bacterium]NIR97797.1 ZIP family metal transporter [Gammaproteobacteria bacterium]NIT63497.1 ZIP family metal transporter [Gammaproteobacteria bacterium]NIV20444.1 ZIP family metal transporter [Gammaproteobacteria bacterium]NIX11026.1 ZIP family metal transporter [Gammaproteobacteria bacterium]
MPLLAWIVLFSLLGGALSVLAAAILLVLPQRYRTDLLPHLVSFAIGVLLGAAFLALLPHALSGPVRADPHVIGLAVLLGLLGFFLLEKMVLWRHCHSASCEAHTPHEAYERGRDQSTVSLVLLGDGLHNLVDGVLIAAAFLSDFHLGIVTSLAVAAHEVPQEVGDFAILLSSGLGRPQALALNILSGLASVVGAVAAYFGLSASLGSVPYVLAVAAASFIYIAVADLIPGLHRRTQLGATVQQLALISTGVVVIYLAHSLLH